MQFIWQRTVDTLHTALQMVEQSINCGSLSGSSPQTAVPLVRTDIMCTFWFLSAENAHPRGEVVCNFKLHILGPYNNFYAIPAGYQSVLLHSSKWNTQWNEKEKKCLHNAKRMVESFSFSSIIPRWPRESNPRFHLFRCRLLELILDSVLSENSPCLV